MSNECKTVTRTRWRRTALLACLVLITHHSSLITAKGQAELFAPSEHYYKAKGRGIGVRWEVESKTVHVGSDLAATLVVTGALNPVEVVKPDLRKFKPFDAFMVTDVADPPRDARAKEVRFAYKLAPRTTDVTKIPALEFRYFNPFAAEGPKQFPATRADAVEITVTDPPKVERPVVPIEAPDVLFQTAPNALGRGPFVPCQWAWLAAALFGPLVAWGWFLAWRRAFPDAVRLARLRRSRAARRALDSIRRANRTPDPPAAVANAVLSYLRTRLPLPESAATPSEIATALKEQNVPETVANQTADVFRACDRARFAPAGDNGLSLATDATAAVAALEVLA